MIDDNIDDSPMSPDELRARVLAQYGDGSDLARTADERVSRKSREKRTGPAEAARQQKRGRTGATFQSELDDTHEGMAARGEGAVYRHHIATKRIGAKKIVPVAGGSLCDYSGHVNVGQGTQFRAEQLRRIPVVFDAKVLNERDRIYRHDHEQMHQLLQLRVAADNGACAFVMVRADQVQRVFLIPFTDYGERLIRGESVPLFERLKNGTREERRLGVVTRVPMYDLRVFFPCVTYTPGKGWLYGDAVASLVGTQ